MGSVNIFITSEASIDENTEQFAEELRHIKCGLLYGDRTTVLSVTSYALMALYKTLLTARNKRLSIEQRIKAVNRFANATGLTGIPTNEIQKRSITNTVLAEMDHQMSQYISRFGWSEVAETTRAQDLKFISPYKGKDPYQYLSQLLSETKEGSTKIIPVLYWIRIKEILEKVSCYPLLSEATRETMRQEISMGLINIKKENFNSGKIAGFSSYMFIDLPYFPNATIQQIIQLRKYLNKYLKIFRHAIAKYSEDIASEQWDKDFIIDAKRVFDKDVAPSLEALKEEIRKNKFIRKFGSNLLTGSKNSIFSLMIGLGSAYMFDSLLVGLTCTASGLALDSTRLAIKDKKEGREAIERNGLYYYLATGDLLRP